MADNRKVAAAVLERAQKVVMMERGNEHGDAEDSFTTIAAFWSSLLSATNHREVQVSGADVAQMMVLLKVARSIHGDGTNLDHYVDAAGYASLAAMIAVGAAKDKDIVEAVESAFKPVRLRDETEDEAAQATFPFSGLPKKGK
jgi:hypothetical protein